MKLKWLSIFAGFLFCWGTALVQAQEKSKNPFTLNVTYTGDLFANVTGGVDQGVRYLDNIDVNLEVNFDHLPLGLDGTTFYIYGIGNQGGSISELAGDVQGISNIEAENSWRVFEVWAQKKFFLANSSLLVGLYDINAEFNVLNSSLMFLNSSHGLDPTIALSGTLGPSTFPYTSLAARLKINPAGGWVIQGAVLDGVPSNPANTQGTKVFLRKSDGIFSIAEIGFHSIKDPKLQQRNRTNRLQSFLSPGIESNNKLAIGGWFYSKEKATWTGNNSELEYGFYALGEYQLFNRGTAGKNPTALSIFGRLGIANSEVSILGHYFGAGFNARGLVPGRRADQTGFAVAYASSGSAYVNNTFLNGQRPEKAETNFETTHQFVLNDYAKIQLNLQYILNPGFNASLNDALVAGSRIILGF